MSQSDPEYLRFGMLNGARGGSSDLKISPLGAGFMYGEGLFETIRVKDRQAKLLELHHARLSASLHSWGAPPAAPLARLQARCAELIAANDQTEGSLKLVVFQEQAAWSELILARPSVYAPARYQAGFRLQTVRCAPRTAALHGSKSLNYLGNLQAKRAATAAGFDEPLFVDTQGQVLEGATTNLFLLKSGRLVTPPLAAHILPGVMRADLLGRYPVTERPVTLDELLVADEVFVTNALLGVMPVASIDAVRIPVPKIPAVLPHGYPKVERDLRGALGG